MQTVLKLLKELRSASANEQGNLFYYVHRSLEDANTLLFFEGYTNEAAHKAHINADYFIKLAVEQIIPLLEKREVTLTTPIAD